MSEKLRYRLGLALVFLGGSSVCTAPALTASLGWLGLGIGAGVLSLYYSYHLLSGKKSENIAPGPHILPCGLKALPSNPEQTALGYLAAIERERGFPRRPTS